MIKINLQLFGGRGGRGTDVKTGGGGNVNVLSTSDLVSRRETQRQEVDDVLSVFNAVSSEYGYQINDIQIAKLGGSDGAHVLAYYENNAANFAINERFFNSAKMTSAYDACVEQGFHPSRGNKSAIEAVSSHEVGHALTEMASKKMGVSFDAASTRIVSEARKAQRRHKGTMDMAKKISGYATHNTAETIAEAFSDVYCNGSKARSESRAIVNVLKGYCK